MILKELLLNKMINRKRRFLYSFRLMIVVCVLLMANLSVYAQGIPSVQLNVFVMQPVSPYLPQLQQDLMGLNPGAGMNSLLQKLQVTIINTGTTTQNLKLLSSIERIAPEPMGISVNQGYVPPQPVTILQGQTRMLNQNDLETSFAGFSSSELVYNNFNMQDIAQNGVNYKLPEGMYRICVRAYDYNNPGAFVEACATFQICYQLSAPQFIMPINTMAQFDFQFEDFTPTNPEEIQFMWTMPNSTCGLSTSGINYELEVHRFIEGQSIQSALQSNLVYMQEFIYTSMHTYRFNLYPDVFEDGEKYVVRVRANLPLIPNSPITIENEGYSQIMAFTYRKNRSNPLEEEEDNTPSDPGDVPYSDAVCDGIPEITNTTSYSGSIKDKDVRVGAFTMTVENATSSSGQYTGDGFIKWNPFNAGIPLSIKVSFKDIKVNTDLEMYEGQVNTVTNPAAPQIWSQMADGAVESMKEIVGTAKTGIQNQIQQIRSNPSNLDLSQITPNPNIKLTFPLGINNFQLGNTSNTLAISSIRFNSQGASMQALFSMQMPEVGDWLSLAGDGFCVYPDRFDMGNGVLYLPGKHEVKMGNNALSFNGAYDGGLDTTKTTYLELQNGGVKKIGIHAQLRIDNKAVVPIDEVTGNRIPTDSVKLFMDFSFTDWNNWIAKLTLSHPFEIANLKGFQLDATSGLYYDHSTTINPSNFSKPTGYEIIGNDNNFQGLYIANLSMQFPKDFAIKNTGNQSLNLSFKNLIIDDDGVSTSINVNNILNLATGSLGGWAFSIDNIHLDILKNAPTEIYTMNGKLKLPISKTAFGYECILNTSEDAKNLFEFNVSPASNMNFDLLAATLSLASNSSIGVIIDKNNKTFIQAKLNGSLNINISNGTPKISIPTLGFKNLVVTNTKNTDGTGGDGFGYDIESITFAGVELQNSGTPSTKSAGGTTGGEEGYDQTSKVGGFSIKIDNFNVVTGLDGTDFKFGLAFDVGLDVGFGNVAAVAAKANQLAIYGKVRASGDPTFGGVGIEGITISGEFGPVSVAGKLIFHNDSDWGEGVEGAAAVHFPPGIDLGAYIAFGKKNNKSFFGFAADVDLGDTGIPIGPVIITGFKGGFFKNMEISSKNNSDSDLDVVVDGKRYQIGNLPGAVPSNREQATILAGIHLSYIQRTILHANIDMKAMLNTANGLSLVEIDLEGNAQALSDGDKGIFTGKIHINFNFEQVMFSAEASLDGEIPVINTSVHVPIFLRAGKLNADQAQASGKKEGDFDFFFYLGKPDDRVKIDFLKVGKPDSFFYVYFGANAYFCVGTTLPDFPGLPQEVIDAFALEGLNSNAPGSKNSNSDVKNASGFMFGASVRGDVRLQVTPIFFKATVIVGFDMALRQINPEDCGKDVTDIGYNNWYANGQFYVYLAASLGIHIDIWFYEADIEIASLTLAALLRAGLPNPTWGEGRVAVRLQLLGGLITINAKTQFEFGDKDKYGEPFKCKPKEDPLASLEMISEVGPIGEEISTAVAPYIFYTFPMNDPATMNEGNMKYYDIEVEEEDYSGEPYFKTRRYRLLIDYVKIRNAKTGQDVKIDDYYLTDENQLYTIYQNNGWNPKTKYEVSVRGSAQELIGGQWTIPPEYRNTSKYPNGFVKDSVFTFTTKEGPKTISNDYIVYSNPYRGQRYYLKDEFNYNGKIKVCTWEDTWFQFEGSSENIEVKAVFIPQNGDDMFVKNATLNKSEKSITFSVPILLKKSTEYNLQLILEKPIQQESHTIKDRDLTVKGSTSTGSTNNGSNASGGSNSGLISEAFTTLPNAPVVPIFSQVANFGGGSTSSAPSTPPSFSAPISGFGGTFANTNFSVPTVNNFIGGTGGNKTPSTGNNMPTYTSPPVVGPIVAPTFSEYMDGVTTKGDGNYEYTLKGKTVQIYSSTGIFRVIYEMKFKTSKHGTFEQKVAAYEGFTARKTSSVHNFNSPDVFKPYGKFSVQDLKVHPNADFTEPFDSLEVYPKYKFLANHQSVYIAPLMSIEMPYNSNTIQNDKWISELWAKSTTLGLLGPLDINYSQNDLRGTYKYPSKAIKVTSSVPESLYYSGRVRAARVGSNSFHFDFYGDFVTGKDFHLIQSAAVKFYSKEGTYDSYTYWLGKNMTSYEQDVALYNSFNYVRLGPGYTTIIENYINDFLGRVAFLDNAWGNLPINKPLKLAGHSIPKTNYYALLKGNVGSPAYLPCTYLGSFCLFSTSIKEAYRDLFWKLIKLNVDGAAFERALDRENEFNIYYESLIATAKRVQQAAFNKETYWEEKKILATGPDGRYVNLKDWEEISTEEIKEILPTFNEIKNMSYIETAKGNRNLKMKYGITIQSWQGSGTSSSINFTQDDMYRPKTISQKYVY